MADTWHEGTTGLLLSDAPPLIPEAPARQEEAARPSGRSRKSKDERTLRSAADNPVARIAVDTPLAHLDRPFDYLVPEQLADQARPGVRVRVRFAGKLTDGFLVERAADSEHQGSLRYLERVVSAEQVLTEEIAGLARAVADRYAGTLADVLRLAVPQRHAATESACAKAARAGERGPRGPGRRARLPAPGPGTRPDRRFSARSPRAARPARPGRRFPARPGRKRSPAPPSPPRAPAAARSSCCPTRATWPASTRRWPALVAPADSANPAASPPAYVTLTAELGPAERYRRWLAALRGEAMIVAGTRAAMFAPVRDLGLVVLWDDGDDLHAEPHAPYPNAREVLALRAHRAGAAALIGGFARTTELTQLVAAGWARPLGPDRQTLRAIAPRVKPAADDGNSPRTRPR